jgi:hypothetical protein
MIKDERDLEQFEIDKLSDNIARIKTELKIKKKEMYNNLCWLTDLTHQELQDTENYFTLKYQVLPSLIALLKDPVVFEVELESGDIPSTDEHGGN